MCGKNHKNFHKTIFILAILLAIPLLLMIGSYLNIACHIIFRNQSGSYKLSKINPEKLAADCRFMISTRNRYQAPSDINLQKEEAVRILATEEGIGTNVPLSIRELNPDCILIFSNRIEICLLAPVRTRIVGFPEGVEGHGTSKLTNGLWRWGPP